MPQPHTHYIITEIAMCEVVPNLWKTYSSLPGSDSFWNDLFYMLDLQSTIAGKTRLPQGLLNKLPFVSPNYPEHDYSVVSDIMHWENSLEAVRNDMDYIKNKTALGTEERDKLKAALYRKIGHAIPDIRLHPEIYRRTRDHWKIHTKEAYDRHKQNETRKDAYLLGTVGHDPYSYHYARRVSSGTTLDEEVIRFLKAGLRTTYAGVFDKYSLDYDTMLGRFEETFNNPLRNAYRHYINAVTLLWERQVARILPQRVSALVPTTGFKAKEIADFDPLRREKWMKSKNPDMPDYSFRELVDLSIRELTAVIRVIEQFFKTEGMTAREFIAKYGSSVPFLQQNWNLDTGLPVSMNDDLLEIDKKHGIRSGLIAQIDTPPMEIPSLEDIANFGLDCLGNTYRNLESLPQIKSPLIQLSQQI